MLLVYILLAVIAVGVLLLSPQGRAILRGASYITGGLVALALLAAIGVFLYFVIPWMFEGGSAQDTIAIAFGIALLIFFLGNGIHEWRKEEKDLDHLERATKKELRGLLRSIREESPKALKGTLIGIGGFVGVVVVIILLAAAAAWIDLI